MGYDVLCVGSATIDVFIDYAKRTRDIKLGEKVLISNLEKHTGGGANNSATALKKMGLQVKALFKIGADHDGELICRQLKRDGVKCLDIVDRHHRTSFSAILKATSSCFNPNFSLASFREIAFKGGSSVSPVFSL